METAESLLAEPMVSELLHSFGSGMNEFPDDIRCVICAASIRPEDGGLCDPHKYDEQVCKAFVDWALQA